jgi:16S rRNA (adenine1518-N6/adenine1519-N6)-dimethyltransferase
VRANKRLGQHFLRDPAVLQEIFEIADPKRSSGVLEIGPGEGALTAFLVRANRPVTAIDRDPRAIDAVRSRLGETVTLVQGDALEIDLGDILPPPNEGMQPIVVANLPYNAGTAIYRRLLRLETRVSRHVLMFQREVGLRIVAQPGTKAYGVLSVLTALCADAWCVCVVPPSAFHPPPKVHSAVLLVEPRESSPLAPDEHDTFASFVGRLFQGRRKTLLNVIGSQALIDAHDLDGKARPETLTPETFLRLFRAGL